MRGVDQQEQLQHSQSEEVSRVSEWDEARVVRSVSQNRQRHSRDHVEEGCERTLQNVLAAYSTDRVCDAPQHTTTQHNSAQHELALCDRCHTAWASGAHGWVPAGHPRYTRADYGQEAVGGSTSRARTRIRTRHAVRTPTVLNTVTGGDQRAW